MVNGQSVFASFGRRVLGGEALPRRDALALAASVSRASGAVLEEVFDWAGHIRRKHFGNEVRFCSIVSGKLGGCGEDCAWCAQSARYRNRGTASEKGTGSVFAVQKTGPVPFSASRAAVPDVLKAARQAKANNVACFCVVNSGRRPNQADLDSLREINSALRGAGLKPACASMGELDPARAKALRAMGVRRYNHNLETSRSHFARLVTTHTYDDRLATLRAARAAGLELCCGGLFGTGDSWRDRVELALTLRDEVRPDVVPLNFLSPIPGTPAGEEALRGKRSGQAPTASLTPLDCLRIIALFRFLLPDRELKICGGRVANLRDLQSWVFRAGATSLMVGNYLTTCGRDARADHQMVQDLGMKLVRKFLRQ